MQQRPICIDLFSGCEGFGLGAELAGFNVVAAVDIEPNLQSSYCLNFPHTNSFLADISLLDKSSWNFILGRGKSRLDLLIGGPPCQGFSRIGKHDRNDPRNNLVSHYFRHIRMLRPRMFVMENVEGLMDKGNATFLTEAIASLPSYYKIVGPQVINAADLGAPTTRKRVIVIGYDSRDVDSFEPDLIEKMKNPERVTVREAISDLPSPIQDTRRTLDFGWDKYPNLEASKLSRYAQRCRMLPNKMLGWHEALTQLTLGHVSGLFSTNHSESVIERFLLTQQGAVEPVSRYQKLAWSGQCPTLRAGTGPDKGSHQSPRPIHPTQPRVITVREAARLQGFPDWFVFHPTKWHSFRMIGNSVSPVVSNALLGLLFEKSSIRSAA
jgi:DNA (cytosine-5)-methyltransferase 1